MKVEFSKKSTERVLIKNDFALLESIVNSVWEWHVTHPSGYKRNVE